MTREPNSSVMDAGLFPESPVEVKVGMPVMIVKLALERNDVDDMAGKMSMNEGSTRSGGDPTKIEGRVARTQR